MKLERLVGVYCRWILETLLKLELSVSFYILPARFVLPFFSDQTNFKNIAKATTTFHRFCFIFSCTTISICYVNDWMKKDKADSQMKVSPIINDALNLNWRKRKNMFIVYVLFEDL